MEKAIFCLSGRSAFKGEKIQIPTTASLLLSHLTRAQRCLLRIAGQRYVYGVPLFKPVYVTGRPPSIVGFKIYEVRLYRGLGWGLNNNSSDGIYAACNFALLLQRLL